MYDIHELEITGKGMAIAVLIVFVLLLVAGGVGYMLGLRNAGKDIPDNGNGVSHIGEQLGEAISNQQQITDGIKDAEHTSQSIAGTGAAIAESTHHIEAGVGEAKGIIDECQQILGTIRNRGQENKAPH